MDLKVDQGEVFFTRGHDLVLVRSNFPRSFRAINIFEASFSVRSFRVRCARTWPRYGNSRVPALAAGVPAQGW